MNLSLNSAVVIINGIISINKMKFGIDLDVLIAEPSAYDQFVISQGYKGFLRLRRLYRIFCTQI